jgi:subtilisin family serine protease
LITRLLTCRAAGVALAVSLAGAVPAAAVPPADPSGGPSGGRAAPAAVPPPAAPADAAATPAPGPERAGPRPDRLGRRDRDLLAEAQARGDRSVTVLIATGKGAAGQAAGRVAALGGSVGTVDERVGYVRATLPPAAVVKAAGIRGVLAVDLNERLRLPDPRPDPRPEPRPAALRGSRPFPVPPADPAVPPPGPGTPDENPYLPTGETGAVAFKRQNPAADGRGVTIGILDSGVDLDHPALRHTSTGGRKIVDWVTATDPVVDLDPTWRLMLTAVTGPAFTIGAERFTAPAGEFRFNRLRENALIGEIGGDLNRDGDTTDQFGVLYDPAGHDVRVDTDGDRDFTDEEAMRPYRERFQVGRFGVDDPGTAVKEQIPFVVQYREDVDLTPFGLPGQKADYVNIGIAEGSHGTHVAGIAAGHRLFGGAMDGAAPGAAVISARACTFGSGCTVTALVEGMIDLVVNRHVDIVNMSIGGLPALNDGDNARALLYNRLINDHGVQLFISAGNSGPGVNTVGDPSVATDAVSVGASVSRATWKADYGADVSARQHVFNFSSRGPREDGGLKPDVTAPGAAVSTIPTWQSGQQVPEAGYALPPGYAMFNGTSMASPQAAGAAALLLSGTKAAGVPVTPAQLRTALYTSAEFDREVPALAQGSGLIDVPGAWRLLRPPAPESAEYTVRAPVCTPISGFLGTPHTGTGIHNRCAAQAGGHRPGQAKDYRVTITRTSGPAGGRMHTLTWQGNDGTFSAPVVVELPLDEPRTIVVNATPRAGVASALLRIDDPATPGLDVRMLAVVVAATELGGPSHAWRTAGSVERNRTTSYFLTVPAGATALQVNLSGIATASQTRFIAINPYGVPVESTGSLACYTSFSDAAACNPISRAYADPLPGVWEIEVESRRTTPFLTNPFRLGAAVQGVRVQPPVVELAGVRAGQAAPVSWRLTNAFGPVTVVPTGGPLGSLAAGRPTIAAGARHVSVITVPPGATRLDVSIGGAADPAADLDLTVFKDGVPVGQSADGDSEESVRLLDPAPGQYSVEVFGYAVPAGSTAYDYRDVFYAASLGTLGTVRQPVALAAGASATVSGTVTAQAPPVQGRRLSGELTLVSSEGAVVGRGTVVIGRVDTAPTPTPSDTPSPGFTPSFTPSASPVRTR